MSDARLKSLADRINRLMDRRDECNRLLAATYREADQAGIAAADLDEWAVQLREEAGHQPKNACIYFLQANGLLKIGVSRDVEQRIKALSVRALGCAALVGTIPGDELTERVVHRQFAQHRKHGEYFFCAPIQAAVSDMIRRQSAFVRAA